MLVRILRSPKKADTYLYLPLKAEIDELPEVLQGLFTPEQLVTKLSITPERQLARISGVKLLEHLNTEGYYLQVPPPVVSLLRTPE
ncbi:hypothetical protein A28LD_2205 [Idiomarina sp. A28L]|uniref:YcgL domain-containing protein n=1 Tax=Idiomarina sp. A28L TaxID=1036674 RepID=UPI0002138CDF|nr:YcgL domain-containing protein [Idiomarina sp. A28L]EGN74407.1 hypothetical protein A28LD_2205 [Idiomarina sp. A28L]